MKPEDAIADHGRPYTGAEYIQSLRDGRADFAVHSIKDVPGRLPAGLTIACVPRREDPRDVLVAPRHGTLAALPQGARVGTSSLRRAIALPGRRRGSHSRRECGRSR